MERDDATFTSPPTGTFSPVAIGGFSPPKQVCRPKLPELWFSLKDVFISCLVYIYTFYFIMTLK